MRANPTPVGLVVDRPSVPVRGFHRTGPIPTQDLTPGMRLRHMGTDLRPIASAALRSLGLVTLALLLILVLLPAALVAAGT